MYLQDYLLFMGAILVCALLSAWASARVKNAFLRHDGAPCRLGMTGRDVAARLLNANGVTDISIGRVDGFLTDHYHPAHGVVNLSESTYGRRSVAAVAVAAHEIGHVMQRQNGYLLYRLRSLLVPVVNFGTRLAMPLVLVGILLDFFVVLSSESVGFYIAMVGVALYGGSILFALVTLPVELNASARAKRMLVAEGILTREELPAASEVLSAAAFTYLASLITSLIYFLRFLLYVLAIFGRRSRR